MTYLFSEEVPDYDFVFPDSICKITSEDSAVLRYYSRFNEKS